MNFWDSSALLPLLVEEPASKAILALYRKQPEIVAAWSATVECVSALSRPAREGRSAAPGGYEGDQATTGTAGRVA